ncbi:MAG: hypothetical protein KAU35_07440 [candidate division Zixibacteria bacterium]|nr:hypothetical protein [candidate division Zixibacteria bacterium]
MLDARIAVAYAESALFEIIGNGAGIRMVARNEAGGGQLSEMDVRVWTEQKDEETEWMK